MINTYVEEREMIDKSQCGNREHRTLKWVVVIEDLNNFSFTFLVTDKSIICLFGMNLYILVMDKRSSPQLH